MIAAKPVINRMIPGTTRVRSGHAAINPPPQKSRTTPAMIRMRFVMAPVLPTQAPGGASPHRPTLDFMSRVEAKFCRNCGHAMERRIPPMEDRERAACPACGFIDYVNPINVVGTVPVWQDRQILLCLRNIEPRKGYWTLPAGFLEAGETSADGALRETCEESGAHIEIGHLFSVLDVPYAQQVHLYWLAELTDLDFDPGPETIEVQMFDFADIPWDDLAFLTVRRTLELFLDDRGDGAFSTHYGQIVWGERKRW